MVESREGVGDDRGPLEERPPMVVDYGPSSVDPSSIGDQLKASLEHLSIADRLFRTPIHREVSVLVGAGAILLISSALFLSQQSRGTEDAKGQLSSEVAEDGGRSNGPFSQLFGGGDSEEAPGSEQLDVRVDEPEAETAGQSGNDDVPGSDGTVTTIESSSAQASQISQTSSATETTAPVSQPTEPTPSVSVAAEPATATSGSTDSSSLSSSSSSVPEPPPIDAGTPFRSHSLPGKIQAEFFDRGGQGQGYNDTDAINAGVDVLRVNSGVDIFKTTNDEVHVRQTRTGEWLQYTVTLPESGDYFAEVSVSSSNDDSGALIMEIDDDRFARFDVQGTGGSGNWALMSSDVEPLSAGVHVIRLSIIDGGRFGIDWFAIRRA